MASSSSSFLFLTALTLLLLPYIDSTTPLKFTLVNNCPFTVYPAILSNNGHAHIEPSGFPLPHFTHRTFDAPSSHWAGRMWGRTHCTTKPSDPNYLSCLTGDCNHQLLCSGKGGALPATLVQFSVHHGHNDQSSYSVSLVDGYNVPLTVTPHEGRGNCPVIGCKPDLIPTCPKELQFKAGNYVVGCKSGCEAFRTDELCCRNHFNNPATCKMSSYSKFFKDACPETYTFAHDNPSLTHECSSPRELKIIFCH